MESAERCVRLIVHAKSFTCEASVLVPSGGYRGRVIDLLNSETAFLALTDVRLSRSTPGAGKEPEEYDVLLLRKAEIEYVIPLGGQW